MTLACRRVKYDGRGYGAIPFRAGAFALEEFSAYLLEQTAYTINSPVRAIISGYVVRASY